MIKYFGSLALLCSLMSPAYAGNFLEGLNRVLNTANAVLGAANGQTQAQSPTLNGSYGYAGRLQPSTQQTQAIINNLRNVATSSETERAISEAAPVLQAILAAASCSEDYDMKNVGQYKSLDAANRDFMGAMSRVQYHPKTQCQDR